MDKDKYAESLDELVGEGSLTPEQADELREQQRCFDEERIRIYRAVHELLSAALDFPVAVYFDEVPEPSPRTPSGGPPTQPAFVPQGGAGGAEAQPPPPAGNKR